ncbi:hypothetical protein A3F66_01195 [candidate division TM6 bacterium RIFCSPHIGHO2_12_FULL_32_22]|nr:MAG: hypothetical protein A3F66_01195 [candidate division TM6 bacterium RIFCSPHIGHO2_12_FULL_32_22]
MFRINKFYLCALIFCSRILSSDKKEQESLRRVSVALSKTVGGTISASSLRIIGIKPEMAPEEKRQKFNEFAEKMTRKVVEGFARSDVIKALTTEGLMRTVLRSIGPVFFASSTEMGDATLNTYLKHAAENEIIRLGCLEAPQILSKRSDPAYRIESEFKFDRLPTVAAPALSLDSVPKTLTYESKWFGKLEGNK